MMKTTNGEGVRVVWAGLEGKKEPVASVGSHHGPPKIFHGHANGIPCCAGRSFSKKNDVLGAV